MPIGSLLPDTITPAETAVLFIDLQKRWTHKRSISALPHIEAFADQVARLGIHSYWIGHEIGSAFHVPRALDTSVAHELGQLDSNCRFLFDMRRHRGYVIEKSEPGAFTNPHLLEHLQWFGVKNVFGCGFIAGQCVATTLIGARATGLNAHMIADLSVDNLSTGMMCNLSRWWVRQHKVPRVRSREVLRALGTEAARPDTQFLLAKSRADGLTA